MVEYYSMSRHENVVEMLSRAKWVSEGTRIPKQRGTQLANQQLATNNQQPAKPFYFTKILFVKDWSEIGFSENVNLFSAAQKRKYS